MKTIKWTRRWPVLAIWLWASWIVMTVSHEVGHVIAGSLAGATLVDFNVAPWRMPSSLHHPDPYPLVTLWGGPLIGVAFPLCVAAIVRRPWASFIANFCLLANGTYLAFAWLSQEPFLDTPRLLHAGARPWQIAIYCLVTIGFGYSRFRRDCVRLLDPSNA